MVCLMLTASVFAQNAEAQRPRTVKPTVYTAPLPDAVTSAPSIPPVTSAATVDELLPPITFAPTIARQGVIVENEMGNVVMEQAPGQTFNPASTIKLATALLALRNFGASHRFATAMWTTGSFDAATRTVTGDLVITGRDPSFHDEHAVEIARELNRLGISTVTGDLIVASTFTMNYSSSALRSGERFYDVLDATRRPAAAQRAWTNARITINDRTALTTNPSVAVMGAVYVASAPANARILTTHRSSELVDILKTLLCYSNNFMAERIGDSFGGVAGLERYLVSELGLPAAEVRLASTSGLGVNRMTPRGMMRVYRALVAELRKQKLQTSDILPVAGIDPGTLQKRYATKLGRGSIIGKTGTLGRTDGGTSALAGEALTAQGDKLYFVIFNRGGNVYRSRTVQDEIVLSLQQQRGGPAPVYYTPRTLASQSLNAQAPLVAAPRTSDEFEANPQ